MDRSVNVEENFYDRLERLATRHGRTVEQELDLAMRQHLAAWEIDSDARRRPPGPRNVSAHVLAEPPADHERLMAVLITLPEDYEPYGERKRDRDSEDTWAPDCSMGCRWFAPLEGKLGYDWGVCANPRSHRRGLLTFEHQGCPAFEGDEASNVLDDS